ncbi:MAG: RNA polymerase sigma factor RpoD/SigA [Cyanobacteriota/Melainabacteria group bacterium]|nr:RNA polymerase sigma factor RpoD/SigA [Candidatus Obscuribacterales bacterium]
MDILSSTIESSELIDDELELEEDLSVEELLQNSSDDISRTFNSPGGTSSVGSLMQCAGKLRALSAREEKEIIKCAQEGDKRSRNFIVMANLKMVASLARRYRNRGLPMVDLMQEGIIGLLNAVNKFDLDKGIRFSTYGAWWVREAMTRSLSNKSRTVRLPVHLNEFMTKLRRVRAELSLSLGRKPTEEELALALSVKTEKVRKALSYTQPSVSLDQPVTNGEGDECALIDLTPDEDSSAPDSQADAGFVRKQVEDLLAGLSKRERQVIRMRFGFGSGRERSLNEVSKELGLTRDQVGKASCKAMRKLKARATHQGLQAIIA